MTMLEKIKQMEDELNRLKQEVEKMNVGNQDWMDEESSTNTLTEVYN
ncbi:hypothetical protein [Brevibacillus daliensis]|nr:hypothetical protein [Brevibacillus daliensis]